MVILRLTPLWDKILSPGDYRPVSFQTLVLGPKPNQYLVCPPTLCGQATAHQTSPRFRLSADQLRRLFKSTVADPGRVTIVREGATSIDLVARTLIMRWPDWVSVRFVPLADGQSTFAVYSRSVYGYSDLGANEKRITGWLATMAAE